MKLLWSLLKIEIYTGSKSTADQMHELVAHWICYLYFMKRKFKQWWSSIPQISTKWTIICHLNWTSWTQKKTAYDVRINVLAWDRHKNVVTLNWFIGSQLSNTYITNDKKPAQICLLSNRPHTITIRFDIN